MTGRRYLMRLCASIGVVDPHHASAIINLTSRPPPALDHILSEVCPHTTPIHQIPALVQAIGLALTYRAFAIARKQSAHWTVRSIIPQP